MGFLDTFGIDPVKFFIQLAIWLLPSIWATLHVARLRIGPALTGWLLTIWLLPILGAVAALLLTRPLKRSNA